MENAYSRQTGEVGQPDDVNTGNSGIGPHALQDCVVFAAVEDRLKIVMPHLVLEDWVEAMKT